MIHQYLQSYVFCYKILALKFVFCDASYKDYGTLVKVLLLISFTVG